MQGNEANCTEGMGTGCLQAVENIHAFNTLSSLILFCPDPDPILWCNTCTYHMKNSCFLFLFLLFYVSFFSPSFLSLSSFFPLSLSLSRSLSLLTGKCRYVLFNSVPAFMSLAICWSLIPPVFPRHRSIQCFALTALLWLPSPRLTPTPTHLHP